MEAFRRVKSDRVMVALSAVPIVAVVVAMTIALVAVNTSRSDAQRAADVAAAQVVELQATVSELQTQAECRDRLASEFAQASNDLLVGTAKYIRELSVPSGSPRSVDWDSILARMDAAQTARAATEQTCAG